jgi:curved DNA-binding protein CbpA
MNGQVSEHPLPELIREVSHKKISGKLQLQNDKIIVVVYFQTGNLVYAACNVKSFRLTEYLLKANLLTAEDLLYLGKYAKDIDLVRTLIKEKRLTETQGEQIQCRQIADVLRLALLWTGGRWEFDNRSHLSEEVNLNLDIPNLLLETARRLPSSFTSSRFRNPNEIFSPVSSPPNIGSLSANEVFVLSRIDRPTNINELITVARLAEAETLQIVYSLAIVDAINRESWKSAFRDGIAAPPPKPKDVPKEVPKPAPPPPVAPVDTVEMFLERMSKADSHYEVLDIDTQTTMSDLKRAYYDIARKYHPDLYRLSGGSLLARVESAFARITQAYDTLRDPGQRASYDSKLNSQRRAAKLAQSAPRSAAPTSDTQTSTPVDRPADQTYVDPRQQAETHFKEGFAALELGQRNVALGMLGSAARAVPTEPRYRAYYGRVLALHESTRRLAETELQAAVKMDPTNAEYKIMLAELYRDLGFTVRAKGEAERALAADRNNRKARDLLKSLS